LIKDIKQTNIEKQEVEDECIRLEKWSKELEERVNREMDWLDRVKMHEKDMDWDEETII